jgi:hypothetical protein
MSITIKHLDGPLKDDPSKREQAFDDNTRTILIGRAAEAQVAYPEECSEVKLEHLILNRDEAGRYTIEARGSGEVAVDGKPAGTGTPVTSGSVVTVGEGGPRFEVILPGVTIRHLDGPLKGQHQYFPDSVETITFGRPPEETDVAYPEDYTKVGRFHFSLRKGHLGERGGSKSKRGAYYVQDVTPDHYVEIGGVAADNGVAVTSGSEFRLGDDDGPTFGVTIEQPKSVGIKTDKGKVVKPVRQEVKDANKKLEETRRQGTYALAALAAVLLAVVSGATYRDVRHAQELAQLTQDMTVAKDRIGELAEKDIPESAQTALQDAVYLVAKREGTAQATAWAFAPDKLATNAHVTEALKGRENQFILIGPNKESIKIKSVQSHPGYLGFKNYKTTQGKLTWGEFTPLNVINEYDVGIIEIDPSTPLPVDPATGKPAMLELASEAELKELKAGAAVAYAGFPTENTAGASVAIDAPPTLQFGNITALTDVFMCRAAADDQLLIQHSAPVTGGVSGSPLIDKSGKVIGIVNGGNTANVLKDDGTAKDEKKGTVRLPSAVLINFAQRVDLLKDLASGAADPQLNEEKAYWQEAADKFDIHSYFESAAEDFTALAARIYGVSDGKEEEIGNATLAPRQTGVTSFVSETYSFELEPGHVYGFIADGKSGVFVGLNVKKKGSAEFLRDEQDPKKTSEPELAPTVLVTVKEPTSIDIDVWSSTPLPADYALRVYIWDKPAADAAASAAPQQ